MNRAKEFEIPTFRMGQKVNIRFKSNNIRTVNKTFTGKVIFKNSTLIVLQNKAGMKESFTYADLHCEDVKLLKN